MQKSIKKCAVKTCLTILSATLLSQAVFAMDDGTKMSYLDSVSTSYLYTQPNDNQNAANSNEQIEASFKLDSSRPVSNSHVRVKLSLKDSDVKQVLRMLADKAGINIFVHDSVEGKLTFDLNDVDINDAFELIFRTLQLSHTFENNTLMVMSSSASKEQGYNRENMTVLPIKYASAESIAEFLNANLFSSKIYGLSNHSVVTSNPSTNQIIVFGSNADVVAIKRILPVIDTKPLINNFKVNHTTPKEMAYLLCDSLFYNSGEESNAKGSNSTDLSSEEVILGGGVIACRDSSDSLSSSGDETLKPLRVNPLTITYFPELGRISSVGGSPEQARVIADFIKEHDKKQLMAYVELSVVELNESGSKEFSNEWNLWTPFISLNFSPSSGLGIGSTEPFFLWGKNMPTTITRKTVNPETGETTEWDEKTVISKSNNKALTYKLKYLIENGNGRVLTNPKIMVTNGKKATIDMTSDYVKSVTSQVLTTTSGAVAGGTQKTYDIGSDEGLKIEIVPFISPDGYVSMNISPEFATIKERVYAANSDGEQELQATLLQRRDLELKNIRIRDGETLVLAGLIRENEQQTTHKMPLLSDLPFIGPFFRGNSNNKAREELVIVVTPHIVKDNDTINNNVYDL